MPGAPQAVLEWPPPRPCAHLPPQQLLQCLPVFLEKRKEKKGESKTRLQNSNQLLQEKANADALQQGARPGTRCRTARSAPCPACTPPGTRCGRTHGHGHTDTDSPPPPQNTHTHTEPRRRVAALPGPCRAVSVPEGRAVGSLPARLQDAGGGGGVALLQHRGVNVAQLGVGCGRARGRLPTPPLARGTALLPRAARSVP